MESTTRGDSLGRRPARRRAQLLAEAGRLLHAVKLLLIHAEYPTEACEHVLRSVIEREQIELQRSLGRIEPRKRFRRGSSHPLLERLPRSLLFIDESGKSFPEPALPAPHYFALGAVAMGEQELASYVVRADAVKQRFFGTADMTFHEPYMRTHAGPYFFDGDARRQAEFDRALGELITATEFVAFGVGVRKSAFEQEFTSTGIDPYLPTDAYSVAITLLLERYIDYLAFSDDKRLGRVIFESQGPKEDAQHQLDYAHLLLDGSRWVPDSAFRAWLETGLRFEPKQGSGGTELADMLSREIFEWITSDCTATPYRWPLFSRKTYSRGDGLMGKFGIKVFPDSDIRETVIAHRTAVMATGS